MAEKKFGKFIHWVSEQLKQNDKKKHFFYAIPVGFLFTELCVLGLASGMEFKDETRGGIGWSWPDWICTMLGGLIGQILQIGVILLLCLIF